jgi:hypothetical protein
MQLMRVLRSTRRDIERRKREGIGLGIVMILRGGGEGKGNEASVKSLKGLVRLKLEGSWTAWT